MNNVKKFFEFVATQRPCPYIDGIKSDTKYFWMQNCSVEHYDKLLERGYRRFGNMFFNPVCEHCQKCLSVRINVSDFIFTKSFRRVIKKNKNTKVILHRPDFSQEHFRLHDKYHRTMSAKKGWDNEPSTHENYYSSFIEGANDFGYELMYFDGKKLIGVALLDITRKGLSAIYCFYDHDYTHLSLGTFSILTQIKIAIANQLPYVYLGYLVRQNSSLNYKEKFNALEVLRGRPSLEEPTIWVPYEQR